MNIIEELQVEVDARVNDCLPDILDRLMDTLVEYPRPHSPHLKDGWRPWCAKHNSILGAYVNAAIIHSQQKRRCDRLHDCCYWPRQWYKQFIKNLTIPALGAGECPEMHAAVCNYIAARSLYHTTLCTCHIDNVSNNLTAKT
jgi:hypothetical protein